MIRLFLLPAPKSLMPNLMKRDFITRQRPSQSSQSPISFVFGGMKKKEDATKPGSNISNLLEGHSVQTQLKILEAYRHGIDKKDKPENTTSFGSILYKAFMYSILGYLGYKLIFADIRMKGPFSSLLEPSVTNFAENVDVNFSDVQGCDEVKKELQDVVQFLKNPEKFNNIGAKLPKGVLLVGPPGVGKTLLARAVAGEAQVPYLYVSGSNFEEVFVGMGASRVRQLFQSAKSNAPCVIFIDEIDSVGRNRTNSPHHPYANQTINQMLAEMDGFEPTEGIIVLGATNQQEDLDKALLRPGRFDMQVQVTPPNYEGRLDLFKLYLKKIKASAKIDVDKLAHGSVGYTGADIQNLVNQAAIAAGLQGEKEVTMKHLWDARDRILMGPAKARPTDDKTNKIAAFHEAGHAIVAYFTKDSIPLHKVTIIPRGMSGGHTSFLHDKDVNYRTKNQLTAMMDSLMGGRVGEELAFGENEVTTGASSDFQNATEIAKSMVMSYGLSSKVGPRVVSSPQDEMKLSPEAKQLIDAEVDRLLQESLTRSRELLNSHRHQHKALAEALLYYETLTKEEVVAVIEGKLAPPKSGDKSKLPFLSRVKAEECIPGLVLSSV